MCRPGPHRTHAGSVVENVRRRNVQTGAVDGCGRERACQALACRPPGHAKQRIGLSFAVGSASTGRRDRSLAPGLNTDVRPRVICKHLHCRHAGDNGNPDWCVDLQIRVAGHGSVLSTQNTRRPTDDRRGVAPCTRAAEPRRIGCSGAAWPGFFGRQHQMGLAPNSRLPRFRQMSIVGRLPGLREARQLKPAAKPSTALTRHVARTAGHR